MQPQNNQMQRTKARFARICVAMGWLRRLAGAMSGDEMDGISLAKPRWVLSGRHPEPSVFFGALLQPVPVGVLLFVEGGGHVGRILGNMPVQP